MTPITYRVVHSSPVDGTVTSTLTAIVDSTLTVPTLVNDYGTGLINSPASKNILTNDTVDSRTQLDPSSIKSCGSTNNNPATCTGTVYNTVQGTYSINFSNGTATFTPNSGYVGTPQPLRYIVRDMLGQLSGNIGSYYPTVSSTTSSSSSTTAPTGNSTSTTITSGSGTTGTTVFSSGSNNGNNQVNTSGNNDGTSSQVQPSGNINSQKKPRAGGASTEDPSASEDLNSEGSDAAQENSPPGREDRRNQSKKKQLDSIFLCLILSFLLGSFLPMADVELVTNKTRKPERFGTPDNLDERPGEESIARLKHPIFRAVIQELRAISRFRIARPGLIRLAEVAYFSPSTSVFLQFSIIVAGATLALGVNFNGLDLWRVMALVLIGSAVPLLGAMALISWTTTAMLLTPGDWAIPLTAALLLIPPIFIIPAAIRGLIGPKELQSGFTWKTSVLAAFLCSVFLLRNWFDSFGEHSYSILTKTGVSSHIQLSSQNAVWIYAIVNSLLILGIAIYASKKSNEDGNPVPITTVIDTHRVLSIINTVLTPIQKGGNVNFTLRLFLGLLVVLTTLDGFSVASILLSFFVFAASITTLNDDKNFPRWKISCHPTAKLLIVIFIGLMMKIFIPHNLHEFILLPGFAFIGALTTRIKTYSVWEPKVEK